MDMIYVSRGILIEDVLVVGGPWMDTRCPPTTLSLLSSAGQEGVHMMNSSLVDIQTERDLSPITIMGKIDLTWEN